MFVGVIPAHVALARLPVGTDDQRRGQHGIDLARTVDGDAVLGLDTDELRGRQAKTPTYGGRLQVLAGVEVLDRTARAGLVVAADQRAHVDDPFALLARDPGPVVRVGRV